MISIETGDCFNFSACLKFLDRGYDECLYQVTDAYVIRLIQISSRNVLIKVYEQDDKIIIECPDQKCSDTELLEIRRYVTDWFDLHRDISGFYKLLESVPQTSDFPSRYYGLRLLGIIDLFEALCWCVIGQQINLTFAHKIKSRLVHSIGKNLQYKGQSYYCFPTPSAVLELHENDLKAMQFSRQKITYLFNIAESFAGGWLNKEQLLAMNEEEQIRTLLKIKGIGPWTANYVSMKCLRNMNCIAYGDTGLSAALYKTFSTERKPDKNAVDKIFDRFEGWKSYLNHYLWKSLS